MLLHGDVVHQFLNQNGFSNTCTTEETDLTAFDIRAEEVDDLDAGFKDDGLGRLILEFRRVVINRMLFTGVEFRTVIDGFA